MQLLLTEYCACHLLRFLMANNRLLYHRRGKMFPILGWCQMLFGAIVLGQYCLGGALGQCLGLSLHLNWRDLWGITANLAHYIMGRSVYFTSNIVGNLFYPKALSSHMGSLCQYYLLPPKHGSNRADVSKTSEWYLLCCNYFSTRFSWIVGFMGYIPVGKLSVKASDYSSSQMFFIGNVYVYYRSLSGLLYLHFL